MLFSCLFLCVDTEVASGCCVYVFKMFFYVVILSTFFHRKNALQDYFLMVCSFLPHVFIHMSFCKIYTPRFQDLCLLGFNQEDARVNPFSGQGTNLQDTALYSTGKRLSAYSIELQPLSPSKFKQSNLHIVHTE
ncbi:hypothetical protein B0H34DRAFT_399071 [Crassisporium funariophilum]|nr:hypothetical protein B0H34DRAFT_399071 [Crassisporium funariophilum]